MPQPIEVKGQAKQQRLADLHGQTATWCFRRELAFDHRKDGFYFGARPIQRPGKSAVHLIADFSFGNAAPRGRGNHAVGSQRATHVAVMGFGVELAVGQHQSNGQAATGGIQQAGQSTRVAPRALSRPLRQNDLAIHIGNQQPLQIVSIARLPAGMLLDATDEVRADRVLRQPGAIDATQARRRPRRELRRSRRTDSPSTFSMVSSGSRRKKRYTVV